MSCDKYYIHIFESIEKKGKEKKWQHDDRHTWLFFRFYLWQTCGFTGKLIPLYYLQFLYYYFFFHTFTEYNVKSGLRVHWMKGTAGSQKGVRQQQYRLKKLELGKIFKNPFFSSSSLPHSSFRTLFSPSCPSHSLSWTTSKSLNSF